jgi:dimethylglycine dehydrogenase
MAGIELPLIPTEHQYFVTETIPEIAAWTAACPRSPTATANITCARKDSGLLVGAYERT